jgi:hypothetical protein
MEQLVGFVTGRPQLTMVLLLVTAIAGIFRSWITHRTTIRHEAEATRRVQLAIGGTNTAQRAAVVRACAELEAASHPVSRSRRLLVQRQ